MHSAELHVLKVGLSQLGRTDNPADWECYSVSIGDDRVSRWMFDNGKGESLVIETGANGLAVDRQRSKLN